MRWLLVFVALSRPSLHLRLELLFEVLILESTQTYLHVTCN